MNSDNTIFTVGHSNYEADRFVKLLTDHSIDAIADVRQSPYSGYASQFNREIIKEILLTNNIRYVFLGDLLGARPQNYQYYSNNYVDFDKLCQASFFQEGIERLQEGVKTMRIALMCAEKDPLLCHRTILVCKNLKLLNMEIEHILHDSTLEKHSDTEKRLLEAHNLQHGELFRSSEEILEDAYRRQAQKMAASGGDL